MGHQDEITKIIKDNKIERIVFTGHSLGGGLANVAHVFVRALIKEGKSGWDTSRVKKDITLKTIVFASVMSFIDQDEIGENSYNIIYGPDVVPRGYAHADYIYKALEKCLPELISDQRNMLLKVFKGPISHKALDFVQKIFSELLEIMVKYRHLGKLLYYHDNVTKPKILTDTGPNVDDSEANDSELKYYKFDTYNIKDGKYSDTLIGSEHGAHGHFPKAVASYISKGK